MSEKNQVDLLLVSDEDKQHYCLIKSMSRLLSNQASKHGQCNAFLPEVPQLI